MILATMSETRSFGTWKYRSSDWGLPDSRLKKKTSARMWRHDGAHGAQACWSTTRRYWRRCHNLQRTIASAGSLCGETCWMLDWNAQRPLHLEHCRCVSAAPIKRFHWSSALPIASSFSSASVRIGIYALYDAARRGRGRRRGASPGTWGLEAAHEGFPGALL